MKNSITEIDSQVVTFSKNGGKGKIIVYIPRGIKYYMVIDIQGNNDSDCIVLHGIAELNAFFGASDAQEIANKFKEMEKCDYH